MQSACTALCRHEPAGQGGVATQLACSFPMPPAGRCMPPVHTAAHLLVNKYTCQRAECLHGVMDTDPLGEATYNDTTGTTSFPMPLGQAAAFSPELVRAVADAISDEARAKSNIYRNSSGAVRCE